MRGASWWALVGLGVVLAFVGVLGVAGAAATDGDGSCSSVTILSGPIGQRSFAAFHPSAPPSASVCASGGSPAPVEVEAGAGWTLRCSSATVGASPPAAHTSVELRLYSDAGGFPNGGGSFWTTTLTSAECTPATSTDTTVYCTSDGLVGGSPRSGMVRIYVRAIRTTLGAYDDNSDQGADNAAANGGVYGAIRCLAESQDLGVTVPGGGPFQGGDTVESALILAARAYDASPTAHFRVKCFDPTSGAYGGAVDTAAEFDTTTVLYSPTITAPPAWHEGCDLQLVVSLVRNSGIGGWGSVPYTLWSTSSAGGVVTNASRDLTADPTANVSFTWSWDGINMTKIVGGANTSTFVIGADQEYALPWGLRDARGEIVSGVAASCYRTRPDTTQESPVSVGMTNATGDASPTEFLVSGPQGQWQTTCLAIQDGNEANYTVSFFHASALTSNTVIWVGLNLTSLTESTVTFNVSATLRAFNVSCDCVEKAFADGDVRLTIQAWNVSSDHFNRETVRRELMNSIIPMDSTYNLTVTLPVDMLDWPLLFFVTANVSGRAFLASESWSVEHMTTTVVETAFDPYIPILLWGGLLVLFVYFSAWFPAVASLMALGASLRTPDVWGVEASVMLVAVSLVLHKLATSGILPLPFSRSRRDSE